MGLRNLAMDLRNLGSWFEKLGYGVRLGKLGSELFYCSSAAVGCVLEKKGQKLNL